MEDVLNWCESEYNTYFSQYFGEMASLYSRIQSTYKPITDNELEQILTDIPLQLFAASEALSQYKARIEVLKLEIKQRKHDVYEASTETSQSARRDEAAYAVLEDEMLLKLYSLVVERVEHELSFSKELIMSAKKIWTARRETESVEAVSSSRVADTLPDYSMPVTNLPSVTLEDSPGVVNIPMFPEYRK